MDSSFRSPKVVKEWKSQDDVVFSESSDIKLRKHGSLINSDKDDAIVCDCAGFGWRSIHSSEIKGNSKFLSADIVFLDKSFINEGCSRSTVEESLGCNGCTSS